MTGLLEHLLYPGRRLRKTPAFTAVVVVALGLGVGANTAIFSNLLPMLGVEPVAGRTFTSKVDQPGQQLAGVGIYGVIAHSAASRTHEIGVRVALGAQHSDGLRLVVGQGIRLAATGMTMGLGAALALTRLLTGFLYQVRPTDTLTFAAGVGLLGTVAVLASYIPARRAAGLDPVMALRHE
jgi:hypothetical protein